MGNRLFALLLAAAGLLGLAGPALAGEVTVETQEIADMKAVYGQVRGRNVVPARARIGGVIAELKVSEGTEVKAGQAIASVLDEKLALQLGALDARIRSLQSELDLARADLDRAQKLLASGAATRQRVDQLRTQSEVLVSQIAAARADRSVLVRQTQEGAVLAPLSGRVLVVPVSSQSVVMPGETIATIAGGGLFLRLALPERHAHLLDRDGDVLIAPRAGGLPAKGRVAKIYPELEQGHILLDVEVDNLEKAFVGERMLVHVPVGRRLAIAVPPEAIATRQGIDWVRLAGEGGPRDVAVIAGGKVETPQGTRIEILSGLQAGDRVVTP